MPCLRFTRSTVTSMWAWPMPWSSISPVSVERASSREGSSSMSLWSAAAALSSPVFACTA